MNAPAALSSSIDIDWILQEPVLVRWKDQSDASSRELWLGQSLEKPAPVTLWVGARAAARSWIVMLQMTITTHFSGRVKSSDVFLFVPPHCCGFDANENTVVSEYYVISIVLSLCHFPLGHAFVSAVYGHK